MAGYFARCEFKKPKRYYSPPLSQYASADEKREALRIARYAVTKDALENGGLTFSCGKKAGHHLVGGRDSRSHIDNKQSPTHRWEACTIPNCGEPIDPHSFYNSRDDLTYLDFKCDEHWLDEFERVETLAKKGVY